MRPPLSTLSAWGVSPLAVTAPCLTPDTPAVHSPWVLPCPSPLQSDLCFLSLQGWCNQFLLVFPKACPSLQAASVSPICVPWCPHAHVLCLAHWAVVLLRAGLGSPSFHSTQSPPRAWQCVPSKHLFLLVETLKVSPKGLSERLSRLYTAHTRTQTLYTQWSTGTQVRGYWVSLWMWLQLAWWPGYIRHQNGC